MRSGEAIVPTCRDAKQLRNDARLQVVVVDEELPYPANSGKRIRTLNLLLQLAGRHQVTIICHRNADAREARQAQEFLSGCGINAVIVDRRTPTGTTLRKDPAFYARLGLNLLSPRPYVVDAGYSAELNKAIKQFADLHQVDVWQCEWTPYLPVMRGVPLERTVVVAHNVESLIWQRYHETERNPIKRWYIGHQWRKMQRFERSALSAAGHVVAVSDEDARLMNDAFGRGDVDVVENGVDTEYFVPIAREREASQILFLGSLDWRPNLDAVRLLIERIFPAVRSRVASATLNLVGRNPPAWLHEMAGVTHGVRVLANVPDVRPMLAECGVMAVPLRIGGGSRLKILEALAMETPVVTTAVGCEGLLVENGVHVVSTESIDRMADALVENLARPESIRAMARRGRQLVVERYDWSTLSGKLEQVWYACAGAATQAEAVA